MRDALSTHHNLRAAGGRHTCAQKNEALRVPDEDCWMNVAHIGERSLILVIFLHKDMLSRLGNFWSFGTATTLFFFILRTHFMLIFKLTRYYTKLIINIAHLEAFTYSYNVDLSISCNESFDFLYLATFRESAGLPLQNKLQRSGFSNFLYISPTMITSNAVFI